MLYLVAGCKDPIDHAVVLFTPKSFACRTTQSRPKLNKSSASLSSVHTQILLVLASNSVITFIASLMLFHGVLGLPPRKKIHKPASSRSLVNNFSSAS